MSAEPKPWAVLDDDSIVENVVLWDGVTEWPHTQTVIDLTEWPHVGIGWLWDGAEFIDVRPEPEPFGESE